MNNLQHAIKIKLLLSVFFMCGFSGYGAAEYENPTIKKIFAIADSADGAGNRIHNILAVIRNELVPFLKAEEERLNSSATIVNPVQLQALQIEHDELIQRNAILEDEQNKFYELLASRLAFQLQTIQAEADKKITRLRATSEAEKQKTIMEKIAQLAAAEAEKEQKAAAEFAARLQKLEANNRTLLEEKETENVRAAALKTELSALKELMGTLEDDKKQHADKLQTLQAAHDNLAKEKQKAARDFTTRLLEAEATNNQLVAEKKIETARAAALAVELSALRELIETLKADKQNAANESAALLHDIKMERDSKAAEILQLIARIDALVLNRASVHKQTETSSSHTAMTDVGTQTESRDNFQSLIDKLNAENKELNTRVKRLVTESADSRSEWLALKAQNNHITAALQEALDTLHTQKTLLSEIALKTESYWNLQPGRYGKHLKIQLRTIPEGFSPKTWAEFVKMMDEINSLITKCNLQAESASSSLSPSRQGTPPVSTTPSFRVATSTATRLVPPPPLRLMLAAGFGGPGSPDLETSRPTATVYSASTSIRRGDTASQTTSTGGKLLKRHLPSSNIKK